MNDKNKDIINKANQILNMQLMKQAVEEMKEYVPYIAEMARDMYFAFRIEGFTEEQAYDFAKEYMLRTILPKECQNE